MYSSVAVDVASSSSFRTVRYSSSAVSSRENFAVKLGKQASSVVRRVAHKFDTAALDLDYVVDPGAG